MSLPTSLRLGILLATLLGLADRGLAQPSAPQLSLRYSFSADNALQLGSLPAGEVAVSAVDFSWRSSSELSPVVGLSYGASWSGYDFQIAGPSAVPSTLHEISLDLGASYRINRQWAVAAAVQPGLYGDFQGDRLDAFNAPFLLVARFAQSRALLWSSGLRVDTFSERPVIPLLGVNWNFAPGWEFIVGYPRVGFAYAATPSLKFSPGFTMAGGSFHVARDPREVTIRPRLDDTFMEYREIRVGLSAEYRLGESFSFSAEVGAVTDQKFEYYDRDITLNGGSTTFFTVGVIGRF